MKYLKEFKDFWHSQGEFLSTQASIEYKIKKHRLPLVIVSSVVFYTGLRATIDVFADIHAPAIYGFLIFMSTLATSSGICIYLLKSAREMVKFGSSELYEFYSEILKKEHFKEVLGFLWSYISLNNPKHLPDLEHFIECLKTNTMTSTDLYQFVQLNRAVLKDLAALENYKTKSPIVSTFLDELKAPAIEINKKQKYLDYL